MSKRKDDKLISKLFAEHRQMMFKIAMGILHNKSDVEDVVQDAFLWIINNLDKISQIPCNRRACYFANIIEYRSLNLINRRRAHPTDDIDEYKDLSCDISVEKAAVERITGSGIICHRIRVATPRHNGKGERQHRIDEERFYSKLRMYSLATGRKQLKTYNKKTNNV